MSQSIVEQVSEVQKNTSKSPKELGRWLGENQYNLVYGGGNAGLMGIIAETAIEEKL